MLANAILGVPYLLIAGPVILAFGVGVFFWFRKPNY